MLQDMGDRSYIPTMEVGMPWKELCTMGIREEFVLRASAPEANVAALCREFGVSRKTGYKWLARFADAGVSGLEDMSRRPKESPLAVSGDVVAELVAVRVAHPTWGAKKVLEVARRHIPPDEMPSRSTVERVLKRAGLVQPGRKRAPQSSQEPRRAPRVDVKAPNDLWTVDFKGWWLAMDKTRCEPLTVRDAFSRYVIQISVLPSNSCELVMPVFEDLFRRYGLPAAIQTDNGPPFATSHGVLGLTRLSAWWLSLGIDHIRSRPATPSDNGAHERMHKDMAAELERFAAMNREQQQKACEQWRSDFNCVRPHEALGMKRPIDVYRESRTRYLPGVPSDPSYPEHFEVRLVAKRGAVCWRKKPGFISNALVKRRVGLEPTGEPEVMNVWFGPRRLGRIDFNETPARLQPEPWVGSEVSPIGTE